MSALIENLKSQLAAKRAESQKAWTAFDTFRTDAGPDVLSNDAEQFAKAEELHKAHAVAAEEARQIEGRLMSAIDMERPVKKDSGEDREREQENEHQRKNQVRFRNASVKAAEMLVHSEEYKAFVEGPTSHGTGVQYGTLFNFAKALDRAELKTLVTGLSDTQGGAFVTDDRQAGLVETFDRVTNVMTSLVNVAQTDSDTIEWVEHTGVTNNAAETPEAVDADKAAGASSADAPESALAFAVNTANVREVKHFIPATKTALADAGQVRSIIDTELLRGLQDRIDDQILNSDGIAPNLGLGILNASGTQTQAKAADSTADAIHKGMTKLLISGFSNLTVLMNANDWQDLRLEKNVNGDYYFGPPSTAGARVVWGMPVVLSQRLGAGTAVVSDFGLSTTMWLREGASLSATDSHSDWFVKGIVAVLASTRAALAVVRPRAICTVTGV